MRTLRALSAAVVLAAGVTLPAAAQSAGGASSFDFLNLDANARPVALGGAYTALATDANALLYNPAGLGVVKSNEVTFMHNQYVQGLTQEYLSYASKQGWGLGLNFLNMGGITRTTYSNGAGSGDFGLSDLALAGGFGHSFGDLSVGGGLKVLREQIDDITGTGFALDGGVLYAVPQVKGLSAGAALQNLGPDVKFQQTKEKLPTQLRAGVAYSRAAFNAMHTGTFDLTKDRFDAMRLGLGVESVIGKMMAVRFGYTTRNDAGIGITAGLGWLYNEWAVDYAVVPFDDLGIAHRVSLTYKWGNSPAAEPGKPTWWQKLFAPAAPAAAPVAAPVAPAAPAAPAAAPVAPDSPAAAPVKP